MPLRARFLPLLLCSVAVPFIGTRSLAQPPDAPSTVLQPAPNPFGIPAPPPEPPLITPEALLARLGGPTTVTFSAQNAPLEEVTQALLAGTGIKVSRANGGGEAQNVSVNWQAKPFWSAAADLETLTGRVWDGRFGDGLVLSRFGDTAGFGGLIGVQSPLVTLVASSVSRSSFRSQVLGTRPAAANQPGQLQRPNRDSIQVSLTAYFDPKLTVQTGSLRGLKFLVYGQDRLILAPDYRSGYAGAVRPDLPLTSFSLSLPGETAPGTRFDSISGTVHLTVVAATEPFSVPDVLATPQMSKKVGAASHELMSATVEGSQLTLRLSAATGDTKPARGFAPFPPGYFSTLRVRDGAGHELPRGGNSSTGTRPEGNFRFRVKTAKGEAIPGPFSLEWPFITEIRSLDVPFELRDVTVP